MIFYKKRGVFFMGIRVGIPVLKLSRNATSTKRKGDAKKVIYEAFKERYSKDKDLDRTRSHLNIYTGFSTGKELFKLWEDEANAHLDARGRKLRSDAVIGYSLIIKPDMQSMQDMSETERIKFLQDSSVVISDLLQSRGLQVDATALHRDELNEHIHLFGHDTEFKAGKKIDITLYREFNSEYPRRMRALGYDVEDMTVYDNDKAKQMNDSEKDEYKAKCRSRKKERSGRSSNQYKADKLAEQEKVLQDREKALEARESALRASQAAFNRQQANYQVDIEKERTEALEAMRAEVEQERQRLLANAKAEAAKVKSDSVDKFTKAAQLAVSAKAAADLAKMEYDDAVSLFREGREKFIENLISDLDRYTVQGKVKGGDVKTVRAGTYFKTVIHKTFDSYGEVKDNSSAISGNRAMTSYRHYFDDIETETGKTEDDFQLD